MATDLRDGRGGAGAELRRLARERGLELRIAQYSVRNYCWYLNLCKTALCFPRNESREGIYIIDPVGLTADNWNAHIRAGGLSAMEAYLHLMSVPLE